MTTEPIPGASAPPAITINSYGLAFTMPAKYAAGHILTPIEANELSKLVMDNCRNNFAPTMRKALAEAKAESAQDLEPEAQTALRNGFSALVASYTFASAPGAKAKADPAQALAEKLATEAIAGALRARGKDTKEFDAQWWRERVAATIDSDSRYLEQAKARLQASAEAAARVLDNFDF